MKIIRTLEKKDSSSLLVGLIIGFAGAAYLDKIVEGIMRVVTNSEIASPMDDIVRPLVSALLATIILELALHGTKYMRSILPSTANTLRRMTVTSLGVSLVLALFITTRLATVANYFGKAILGQGDSGGLYPTDFKTNVLYPILAVVIGVILVEIIVTISKVIKLKLDK